MKVIPNKKGDKLTVSVAGRLDALTVPEFEKQLGPELWGIKELAEYEMKLKIYSIIRSFAGVTFSELVPKEALPHITKEISEAFLAGLEKMNS